MENNLNSKSELYEGDPDKGYFDYTVHHRMPKINYKRRRRKAYQGIVNVPPPEKNQYDMPGENSTGITIIIPFVKKNI